MVNRLLIANNKPIIGSIRTGIINDSGEVLKEASVGYPLLNPEPKAAEQNPDEIVMAVKEAIRMVIQQMNLKPDEIKFLSFSAAMHSLIALDDWGNPLTHSITWADQRSEKQARQLKETNGQATCNSSHHTSCTATAIFSVSFS